MSHPIRPTELSRRASLAPPNAMQGDVPPKAPPRPLRIAKKPKRDSAPSASAAAAPMGSEAQAPAPPATKMHAWQQVAQFRKDLSEMRRPPGTQEEVDSVRSYTGPTIPIAVPTGPDSQRGSNTQRGSTLKFALTTALVVPNVMRGDVTHSPGAPMGNAVPSGPAQGRSPKAPPLTALAVGTDLWNATIPCHVVLERDPAPTAKEGTSVYCLPTFGKVFTESSTTFDYVAEPDDGSAGTGWGPNIRIEPTQGGGGPGATWPT